MEEKFLCGMLLGVIGGALIVSNSVRARQVVKNGAEQVKKTVSGLTKKKNSKK